MSASLKTPNFNIPKYAPNDVTSYLTTYNDTMDLLDTTMYDIKSVADEAKATGDTNLNNISALATNLTQTNNNVSQLGKTVSAQEAEIEHLASTMGATVVGDYIAGNNTFVTPVHPSEYSPNTVFFARKLGKGLNGFASISEKKGTYTNSGVRTFYNGNGNTAGKQTYYVYPFGVIAGNPFELSSEDTFLCTAFGVTGDNTLSILSRIYYYDAVTQQTVIGMYNVESTVTIDADIIRRYIF